MAWRVTRRGLASARLLALTVVALVPITGTGAAVASTSVDLGDISHKGLKDLGPASTGLKLSLELGLVANQQGIANARQGGEQSLVVELRPLPVAVDAAEGRTAPRRRKRNAVVSAFKTYGVTATVDVTHLRVSATISVKNAQKMFGTKWDLYATGQTEPGRSAAGRHAEAALQVSRATSTPCRASGCMSPRTCLPARRCPTRGRPGRLRSTAGRPPARARSTRAAPPRPIRGPSPRPPACFRTRSSTPTGLRRCTPNGLEGQGIRVADPR